METAILYWANWINKAYMANKANRADKANSDQRLIVFGANSFLFG